MYLPMTNCVTIVRLLLMNVRQASQIIFNFQTMHIIIPKTVLLLLKMNKVQPIAIQKLILILKPKL